jgi:hypothetical protein
MNQHSILSLVEEMDPLQAAEELAMAAKKLFAELGPEALDHFVTQLIGPENDDKTVGLVHLWLATCMDEGVDPRSMCRSLVDKISQSEQLREVTDPEILLLFEDWLEELEREVLILVKNRSEITAPELARELGVSESGAMFLLMKMRRANKI